MTPFSDQPHIVETLAFTLYLKESGVRRSAFDRGEWEPIWQRVDEVTKERLRERAMAEMRDFEADPK